MDGGGLARGRISGDTPKGDSGGLGKTSLSRVTYIEHPGVHHEWAVGSEWETNHKSSTWGGYSMNSHS